MTLHSALVRIFGAEPEDIHVPHLTHLIPTLNADTTQALIRSGGPRWVAVLERIETARAMPVDGRLT